MLLSQKSIAFVGYILLLSALLLNYSLKASELKSFTVESNGHALRLWFKASNNLSSVLTNQTDKSSPNILLLHGRTWSSLPDFDLQVQGEKLSLMDNLNQLGFNVWALDARGYGETARDESGWNTPNKASLDVFNTLQWINRKTNQSTTLFGWSYGSMVAQLTLQKHPKAANALILYGFPIDPEEKIEAQTELDHPAKKINTAKNAASDFIVPGSISQKAIQVYVKASLKADPIRADWRAIEQWNQLDASQLNIPLLLLQGEFDPLAKTPSHARFFSRLPNANKQWIVLAGGDHAALLETPKDRLAHAVKNFVDWLSF
ncbi:MAG: alpha/beta fold hydrolase [Enterobacterales bacterium]|nr:alpha/beta fold hydrolase [Enterobacterales bacterium]